MRILKPFARQMTTIGHHKPPSIDAVNIKYVRSVPTTYRHLWYDAQNLPKVNVEFCTTHILVVHTVKLRIHYSWCQKKNDFFALNLTYF